MFYLIDKPLWISSFDVIRRLRKELNTKKIGHTGTLDPLATWCLLIATDNSTKLIPLLEKLEKSYSFKLRIDWTTPSLDMGTEILYHWMNGIVAHSREELISFLEQQKSQIPPGYSALKVDGVRSYERARKWETVILKERPIHIQEIEVPEFSPPEFEISLRISSGGYIRSLAKSIGEYFGLPGWYITELRRDAIHTTWYSLLVSSAQNLDTFKSENYLPYETLFPNIEVKDIDESLYQQILQWRIIQGEEIKWEWKVWQKIFFKYKTISLSLMEYSDTGFVVIRNNV